MTLKLKNLTKLLFQATFSMLNPFLNLFIKKRIRKPLVKILGREMVLRVADICEKVSGKENLYIATDSKKIQNAFLHSHNP